MKNWQPKLLSWYRKTRRDLPWRKNKDPYRVWISEIMLQQTTVETVIPYYERFLKNFPTVKVLAEATEEGVLKFWSGLGYYSRARNLRKAAQMVMQDFGGTVPSSVEDLIKLPGIGRYTAGAISSIAFDRKSPILDGNVMRVLSRIFCIEEDPKSSSGQKVFWKAAEEVLPEAADCGDFNQALMELGATVCVPENPLCLICPVMVSCEAHVRGVAKEFPKIKKQIFYRDVEMTAAVVQKKGKVLFVKRAAKGLLGGMWELPMVEGSVQVLSEQWPIRTLKSLSPVRHSIMNRRIKVTPLLCDWVGEVVKQEHQWVLLSEIGELATSSMNRKIMAKFAKLPL